MCLVGRIRAEAIVVAMVKVVGELAGAAMIDAAGAAETEAEAEVTETGPEMDIDIAAEVEAEATSSDSAMMNSTRYC